MIHFTIYSLLSWGKIFVVFVVEHWTTNILPMNEATLPTFTCSASSNHENKTTNWLEATDTIQTHIRPDKWMDKPCMQAYFCTMSWSTHIIGRSTIATYRTSGHLPAHMHAYHTHILHDNWADIYACKFRDMAVSWQYLYWPCRNRVQVHLNKSHIFSTFMQGNSVPSESFQMEIKQISWINSH